MTWRITFDCDDADQAMRALRAVMVYDITLGPPERVQDDLSDDETAADISELHAKLDQLEAEITDSDPTPPHGIARPDYYVLRQNVTQGSGHRLEGIERVPCAACGAGPGEVCITEKHEGYRRGFGHAARRKLFMREQS